MGTLGCGERHERDRDPLEPGHEGSLQRADQPADERPDGDGHGRRRQSPSGHEGGGVGAGPEGQRMPKRRLPTHAAGEVPTGRVQGLHGGKRKDGKGGPVLGRQGEPERDQAPGDPPRRHRRVGCGMGEGCRVMTASG